MRFVEFRKHKTGKAGQLKGKDAIKKKSKPGGNETPHPARGKLVGEDLNEAEARIQHLEDVIFWEGSKGAMRALQALRSMDKEGHKDVTIKWDGSPAVIFGRNENGEFTLTDKSGFQAKGYDGRPTSAEDLQAMFINRKKSKGKDAHQIQVIEPLGREKLIYLDARTDEKFVSLMTSEAAKEITDDISVSVSVDSKDIFIFDLDGNRLK